MRRRSLGISPKVGHLERAVAGRPDAIPHPRAETPDPTVLGSVDALRLVAAQLRERAELVPENRRPELLALAAEYDLLAGLTAIGRGPPPTA